MAKSGFFLQVGVTGCGSCSTPPVHLGDYLENVKMILVVPFVIQPNVGRGKNFDWSLDRDMREK